jgi:hypothetical protein
MLCRQQRAYITVATCPVGPLFAATAHGPGPDQSVVPIRD